MSQPNSRGLADSSVALTGPPGHPSIRPGVTSHRFRPEELGFLLRRQRLEVLVKFRHAMLVALLPGGRADARPDSGHPQPVEHEVGVEKPVLGKGADRLSPVENG